MESVDTSSVEKFLSPYLPQAEKKKVFITATWAQSLDGRIAAGPGERTILSGMYSKKMTHYLRTKHDAILVGRQTVAADNPKLNCRYSPTSPSPRPVILDSKFKWDVSSWQSWQVLANAANGLTLGPWVIVDSDVDLEKKRIIVEQCHGEVIRVTSTRDWKAVSSALAARGVHSLMVEGGAEILDGCLDSGLVDAVIITLAPVFLGKKGVDIATTAQHRLQNVQWWSDPAVVDGVIAGTL